MPIVGEFYFAKFCNMITAKNKFVFIISETLIEQFDRYFDRNEMKWNERGGRNHQTYLDI